MLTHVIDHDGPALQDLLHVPARVGRISQAVAPRFLVQLDHDRIPLAELHVKDLQVFSLPTSPLPTTQGIP